jgi:hypothetical protein
MSELFNGQQFEVGAGILRERIEAAASAEDTPLGALTVLSSMRDPHRLDTSGSHTLAQWFANQADALASQQAGWHLDIWLHELHRDGKTLVHLMFPIERLKELARAAVKAGRCRSRAGDDGRFDVALIRLSDILQ